MVVFGKSWISGVDLSYFLVVLLDYLMVVKANMSFWFSTVSESLNLGIIVLC